MGRKFIVAGSLPGMRFNIGQWGGFINVHLTAPLRIWGYRKQGPVRTILLLWTELSWWREDDLQAAHLEEPRP